jgi:predicted nucleic acid-binding protein
VIVSPRHRGSFSHRLRDDVRRPFNFSLYEHLLENRLQILVVDSAVAKTFSGMKATCRRKGFGASDFDLLIPATAKAHGLILATLNPRHFIGIEGLAVEDWSRS